MSSSDYYMGFDDGGYDGRTYCFIVHNKSENKIMEHHYSHDKDEFEKQKALAIEKYCLPESHIFDTSDPKQ